MTGNQNRIYLDNWLWSQSTLIGANLPTCSVADCVWNVMAHAQKPDFVFRQNGRVHLNRRGRQFSRLLAAEVCVSKVVMLYTPCSEVVWRVLTTHSIRQFSFHFPYHASPCAITFQLHSTAQTDLCKVAKYPDTILPHSFAKYHAVSRSADGTSQTINNLDKLSARATQFTRRDSGMCCVCSGDSRLAAGDSVVYSTRHPQTRSNTMPLILTNNGN
jgi:hypothetical protein